MRTSIQLFIMFFVSLSFATDTIDNEKVREVVIKNISQIQACYNKRLTEGMKSKGQVDITWSISDRGEASDFKLDEDEVRDDRLFQCIGSKIKTWKFPPAPKGKVSKMSFPFVFSARSSSR